MFYYSPPAFDILLDCFYMNIHYVVSFHFKGAYFQAFVYMEATLLSTEMVPVFILKIMKYLENGKGKEQ